MTSILSKQVSSLLRSGKVPDAIALATQKIANGNDTADAYSALAHAHLINKDSSAALVVASEGILLSPSEPALRFLRARINFMDGAYSAAVEDCAVGLLQETSTVNQYYAESLYLLAAASWAALGDIEKAQAALKFVGDGCAVRAGESLTRDGVAMALLQWGSAPTARQSHSM